jgi:hypothetical protein
VIDDDTTIRTTDVRAVRTELWRGGGKPRGLRSRIARLLEGQAQPAPWGQRGTAAQSRRATTPRLDTQSRGGMRHTGAVFLAVRLNEYHPQEEGTKNGQESLSHLGGDMDDTPQARSTSETEMGIRGRYFSYQVLRATAHCFLYVNWETIPPLQPARAIWHLLSASAFGPPAK